MAVEDFDYDKDPERFRSNVKAVERYGFKGGEFPVAERFARRALALPMYAAMTEGEIARVAGALSVALARPDPT